MKKIIGYSILLCLVILLFLFIADSLGFSNAIRLFIIAAIPATLITLAVYIANDENR